LQRNLYNVTRSNERL